MPSILITGSNRGLGLEWTRQYARLDWQVYATCCYPDEADDLQQLKHDYPNIQLHRLDVTNPDEIDAIAETLKNQTIDILLNNAGVYLEKFKHSTLGHIDYSDWEETFGVNSLGAVRVTDKFIDNVARSEKRLIVAITSHMGSIAEIESPGSYAYRSSKAALNAAMKGISLELKQRNVGVLLLHPGWVKTRMGGPDALISTTESVNSMRAVIENFDIHKSGNFYRFDGSVIPW
jgi:NAD(P)-dependent dehydrogenase (short-subunit alcohol dehydrogenase family)